MILKSKQAVLLVALSFFMLLTTVVLGCIIGARMTTPETKKNEIPAYTPPSDASTTLKIAVRADADPEVGQDTLMTAMNTFLTGFSTAYPDIAVRVDYLNVVPSHAKETYDLILVNAEEVIEYTAQSLSDLSDWQIPSELSLLSSAMNLGVFGESRYFVPFTYDRAVLYADRSVFETLGVPLPTEPMDEEAFDELLTQLSKNVGGTRYVGAYMPFYMSYVWMMYARSQGGALISESGDLTLSKGASYKGLQHMFTLLDYGYIRSWKYGAYGSDTAICAMSLAYAANPERDGRYVISDAERAANPAKNTDALLASGDLLMLPLPTFDGKYYGTANSAGTWGFGVIDGSANRDAALSLIAYALGEEGQKALNAYYGGIPVNKATWEQDFWRRGALGCEGSEHVLTGIEQDSSDRLDAMLDASKSRFEKNSVRLKTLEWCYFYDTIGNGDHTVAEYYKKWLEEFEYYANQLN